ncbi:HD domain-containing phosphohydrolase [Syntrophothermus lipocalidus]|uniref:PAS/PAC sensor protein n=1 Tax=Syntrophothermus lipocalidus (strain DSM 12680 / TGB-C1) TaxID=643648 RepID=D7CLB9_SYNLT|nr:HD domain-containing phosphohydrolase [Syntrophothermus lipocalidus]ADI01504.1 putative PAS/PAC sensor protein [Syntrophothermus lipocalidus DSM 12680]
MGKRTDEIGVAIIGGGQGCLELLQLFDHLRLEEFQARIVGVADLRSDVPGMLYARAQGLMTTTVFTDFYSNPDVKMIIELTGSEEVLNEIYRTKPPYIKVIDHVGARLFWDLMKLKAEHRARNILESTRDAYLVVNSKGSLLHFNQAASEMLRQGCELRIGTSIEELMNAVFGIGGLQLLNERTEGVYTLTAFRETPAEFPAEISLFRAEIDEDECLVISIRDVSERLQAEKEISRLHRYERLFSNAAADFALSRNLNQSIRSTLKMIGESFGECKVGLWRIDSKQKQMVLKSKWSADEEFDDGGFEILKEKDVPVLWREVTTGRAVKLSSLKELTESERVVFARCGIRSLAGVPVLGEDDRWGVLLVESKTAREWTDGELELLSAIVNIMESGLQREKAQRALRESEALYQAMVDKSLTGIYILQDGVFLYVNKRMAEIFGYAEEELLNKNPLDVIVYPGDRWLVDKQLKDRLSGEVSSVHYIFRGVRRDGKVIWLECMGARLMIKGRPAIIGNLMDVTERIQNEEQRSRIFDAITMLAVGMVEQRDPYTAGHQRRVAAIATAIGRYMGLPEDRIEGLRLAALLHDIGKFAVPIEILTKPGKLRPSEFEFIKLHSQVGAEILAEVPFPWDISSIVTQHHERLDGSGYPSGLRGEEICLEARIIAVADVVEAMSSHRPYRPSLGLEAALEEVKNNAGKLYDPEVVRALLEVADVLELQ